MKPQCSLFVFSVLSKIWLTKSLYYIVSIEILNVFLFVFLTDLSSVKWWVADYVTPKYATSTSLRIILS